MLRLRNILTLCLGVMFAGAQAQAAIVHLQANMTHDQEAVQGILVTNPGGAPRPLSFGTAHFVLDTTALSMSMVATIFNIDVDGTQTPNDSNDNLTAAHIHAANPNPPTPLPPTFPVRWGFFGTPDNDNNPSDLVVTKSAGVGGTFTSTWDALEGNGGTTLSAQIFNLLNGLAYLNFHTTQFGGGEIRGTLFVVPEPASLGLLGLGLFGLAAMRRRQL